MSLFQKYFQINRNDLYVLKSKIITSLLLFLLLLIVPALTIPFIIKSFVLNDEQRIRLLIVYGNVSYPIIFALFGYFVGFSFRNTFIKKLAELKYGLCNVFITVYVSINIFINIRYRTIRTIKNYSILCYCTSSCYFSNQTIIQCNHALWYFLFRYFIMVNY